jgi:hypothetical protein
MNVQSLEHMLREGKITAADLLRQTAVERVDGTMAMLLRHLPYDEVCRALYERIGSAPLADFDTLRMVYFKHCDHAPSIASASKHSVLSYLAAASARSRDWCTEEDKAVCTNPVIPRHPVS